MARSLRIDYLGVQYHVMNQGDGYRTIFNDDQQRGLFRKLLADLNCMFRLEIHAYFLLGNRYHILVHTPEGNLQRGMQHLNRIYIPQYLDI